VPVRVIALPVDAPILFASEQSTMQTMRSCKTVSPRKMKVHFEISRSTAGDAPAPFDSP
jgi:hypothetical protein